MKIIFAAIVLVVGLWLGIAAYVNSNKKSVLKEITEQLNENINGKLSIESMEPTLVRGFPGISIELKNVLLRDSLWEQHHHDLLQAENIYVSINAFSIIRGKPRIRDISIEDGNIYLFTDSTGYSNTHIFKRTKERTEKEQQGRPRITNFYFKDINFVFENNTKFKLFQLDIKKLAGTLNYTATGWDAKAEVSTLIKEFCFNINAGSFLKNKTLDAGLIFSYDQANDVLTVPMQEVRIDKDDLELGAKFFLKEKPSNFEVNIKSDGILYKNAVALVSPNISRNLKLMDLEKPLALSADIKGKMKFRDTPLVKVHWDVKDNIFIVPGGKVTDISFKGNYTNEVDPIAGHNDKNSRIEVYGMKGKYYDIPFTADSLQVTNLIQPTLEGRFKSKFQLSKLSPLLGEETFMIKDGEADLNLIYRGTLNRLDTTPSFVNGYIQVKNTAVSYIPRALHFTNSNITLLFRGHDVFVTEARLQSGSTVLNMSGSLKDFFNFYYTAPEKITLDWNIRSSLINLNEFRSLLSNRQASRKQRRSKVQVSVISSRLDKLLEQSSVHMLLHIDKAIYRKFVAGNINADVTMTQNAVSLKNITVSHADGRILLNANMNQGGPINHIDIDANIENVHLNDFLDAFENFGQTTLNSKNIKGRFFAKAKVSGNIKDNGDLVPRSMHGTLDFNLKDGALVNFEPLMKVGKFIFRKRKLENITFADIKNKLDLRGDKIYINPMLIETSAINAKVEGIYALGAGTDVVMDIPLRNPKKDELVWDDSLKAERQMKGLVLHLRAMDGEDGKVKIKWNKDRDAKPGTTQAPEKADDPEKEKKKFRLFKRKNKETN